MPVGLTPVYRIEKGGFDITDHFNDRTTQIEVKISSGSGESDTFSMTLDDRDFAIELPVAGANLQISLGYAEVGMANMGVYEINEIYLDAPPQSMRLMGFSTGMRGALKSPTTKDYTDKTVGELVQDIAKQGGVDAVVAPEFQDIKVPQKNQFQSGLHLLHQLEIDFDAVAKFEYGKLVFAKRDSGETFSGMSLPLLVLKPEHISRINVKITDRNDYPAVKAAWWDAANGKRVYEQADNTVISEAQKAAGIDPAPFIINKMFNSKQEAEAAAKSKVAALNRARGDVTVTLAKGDPWIRAQMPVLIAGLREGMNGNYIIDQVTHTYVKEEGLRTMIIARPPGDATTNADQAGNEFFMPTFGETLGMFDGRTRVAPGGAQNPGFGGLTLDTDTKLSPP